VSLFSEPVNIQDLLERIQALEAAVFQQERRPPTRQDVPQEISEAWDTWSKYRQGKGWTAAAKTINSKKLMELSKGDSALAVRIVEQSVERGWTGLFPLKDQPGPTTTAPAKMKTVAEVLAPSESKYERQMGYLRHQLRMGAITQEDYEAQARQTRDRYQK
jgi:hypothetical protein